MNHESFCRLHEALDKLKSVSSACRDMPFLLCEVEAVRNSVQCALDASKHTDLTQ
jgi:hypothetical protein